MKPFAFAALSTALLWAAPAGAAPSGAPTERRLHSNTVESSSFLWNDWNQFVENYHPNYVADDDPATAWVEGAKSSGAGEWLLVGVTRLDDTTKVRIRIRNGYQKSKELWKANARAKEITLRLHPSKVEKKVVLADQDGWQELAIEQPNGPVSAVELGVRSVYEGTKYPDLAISDVQVFATSKTPDNPAFEKSKRAELMAWRASRIAAAKAFKSQRGTLPLYPAYEITRTEFEVDSPPDRESMLAMAQKDEAFTKEWKDALAFASSLEKNLGSLTRAQLAPTNRTKLIAVDGLQITTLGDIHTGTGPNLRGDAIRLPMLGTVASMFSDQLRVLDLKEKLSINEFARSEKTCKSDVYWVGRAASKEATGPARVQALAIGRCEKLEGREGSYLARSVEILVYDATGKLMLTVGEGHIEGYRWTTEDGKPMLVGGRSVNWNGFLIDATRRDAVAAK